MELNNITEMQCLFTHKLIADPDFHREICDNLEQRIRKYNDYYHVLDTNGHADHLVHYGFYTDDIARLMKIGPRLADCRSIKDLVLYFIFPNSAFKYRQSGPYAVPGVKEMVDQIYRNHRGFSVVINYLLTYSLLQMTAYVALIVAYYRHGLPGIAVLFLFLIILLNPVTSFVAANGFGLNSYLNVIMVAALGLTAYYQNALIPVASMLAVSALTYIFHRLGWTRAPFNDLLNKKSGKYREFFKRYCQAFKEAYWEIDFPARRRKAES